MIIALTSVGTISAYDKYSYKTSDISSGFNDQPIMELDTTYFVKRNV